MKKQLKDYKVGDIVIFCGKVHCVEVIHTTSLDIVEWCLGGKRLNVFSSEITPYVK